MKGNRHCRIRRGSWRRSKDALQGASKNQEGDGKRGKAEADLCELMKSLHNEVAWARKKK